MVLPLIDFFTGGLFAKVVTFVLASYTVRLVSAVGFAVITYTGIDLLYGQLENAINTELGGLPSDMLSMFNLFGFTFVIQAILSAFTAIIAIKGLQSLKRGVLK